MGWGILSFLAEPWFVIPWYAVGLLGSGFVLFDLYRVNTPLKQAMKWAWPIIVVFFSIIGLALYFGTARAPDIGKAESEEEKKRAHDDYERNMARRVNGAVIHCVAGDGLGIMTGMVIARVFSATFWQEFWFEYLVGFFFGWFIFQFKSMRMMTGSRFLALAMAFRAEFFSMLTVMAGMGAVMTFVTPFVVGAQPKPLTFAFWGFGMLGLLVGYVFTFPMNWMMVKIGWKHGMGGKAGAREVKGQGARLGLLGAMIALGIVALMVPAWLTEVREGMPAMEMPEKSGSGIAILTRGLGENLQMAEKKLGEGSRKEATQSMDGAMRAAEVGAHANSQFRSTLGEIKRARRSLQMGNPKMARAQLALADAQLPAVSESRPQQPVSPKSYQGVPVIDANGMIIGKVARVSDHEIQLALGGFQDVWGFLDLGSRQILTVPAAGVVFGPKPVIGKSYVMLLGLG